MTGVQAAPGVHRAAPVAPPRLLNAPRWGVIATLVAAQVGASLLLNAVPRLVVVQAAGIGLLGLYAVARRQLPILLCLIAYLPGAEMLWRQTKAPLYYLAAPYLVIMLGTFATLGIIGRLAKPGRMALIYVGLLLPATVVTIKTAGPGSREILSFALTGPIALAVLVTFTSQVRIERWLYVRLLWVLTISSVGPLTIAATALRSGITSGQGVNFTDQSNFLAAGGTAPVQVSALLGLGVLTGVLLIINERNQLARLVAVALTIALTVQCFLTFSRGGMTSVAIALSALLLTQARDRELRNRLVVILAIGLALCFGVIFPKLDSFTQGAFKERFTDSQTGRTALAANDLQIFRKNPVFGVGPGMTKYQRLGYDICQLRSDQCINEASSHTEFTRMLSEHGVPGLLAIAVLVAMFLQAIRRADRWSRPLTIALLTWGVAQMFYANFRIVAVPVALGLAFVRVAEPGAPPQLDADGSDEPRSTAELGLNGVNGYSGVNGVNGHHGATHPAIAGAPVIDALDRRW
jgi:O-antigen ligase